MSRPGDKLPRRPLNDRLADRAPRDVRPTAGPLVRTHTTMRIERPEAHAVVTIGAMILQKMAEFGQTRASRHVIDDLVARATESLTAEEVMRLEVEAFEVMDWLLGPGADTAPPTDDGAAPRQPAAVRRGDKIYYDPHAPVVALVERAIAEGFDLKIDYFSRRRGEMNTRRITPRALDAETYVRAYCHARRDERVFRINRITRALPVGGRPVDPKGLVPAPGADEAPARQMSLLDDD